MRFDQLKRRKYTRRVLMGALVFTVAMAQNVPWLPPVYGARALPLLPLVAVIAVYDQPVPAILFGALAGALWDVASPAYGLHAVYLAAAAFACAMCMRYFLNRNLLTVALLCLGTAALYLLARWFADYAVLEALTAAEMTRPLLREALPTLGYTMLTVPVCALAVTGIVRRTSRRQITVDN